MILCRALTPSTVLLDTLETVWLTTTQGGPLCPVSCRTFARATSGPASVPDSSPWLSISPSTTFRSTASVAAGLTMAVDGYQSLKDLTPDALRPTPYGSPDDAMIRSWTTAIGP